MYLTCLLCILTKQEMLELGDPVIKKHVQEYTKRIAGKIAALESLDGERQDEIDDEREISSIGGMAFS
jgi:hypothetical protein